MNIVELYEIYRSNPSVQTDTRKLKPGDIFFALRGPNFNANEFAETAIANGAVLAVIDDPDYQSVEKTVLVNDALETLQQLALYHRNQFSIPFLAITGSNGKTTTKELIHAVLSSRFKTYTTEGNLNNHIGIPLTILKVRPDAQMAVIEMGANHQREIASYCVYTRPDYGLITNVGKAHLEGFGGIEGVKKGKGELYDHLRSSEGTAFVMWDYDYLRDMSKGIKKIIKYGTADADVTARVVEGEPFLKVKWQNMEISTSLVGAYNLPNVLAAITVGKYFGVPDETIKEAIENYAPNNSRSQLTTRGSNQVILDSYNANPSSMRAAIENFIKIPSTSKILVLGGMAELGDESLHEHKAIVDLIAAHAWKEVILVGGDFLKIDHPYRKFENSVQAGEWLKKLNPTNSYLLVKGSRSMRMERVLDGE